MVSDDHPDVIRGIPFEQIREIIDAKLDVDEYVTDIDEPVDLKITTHENISRVRSVLEPMFTITDPPDAALTLISSDQSHIALQVNPSRF